MIANLSGGGNKVHDVGRSSRSGAYALLGNFTGANGGKIVAPVEQRRPPFWAHALEGFHECEKSLLRP